MILLLLNQSNNKLPLFFDVSLISLLYEAECSKTVSSAYIDIVHLLRHLYVSLTRIMESRDPRIDLCGTPRVTDSRLEQSLLYAT